MIKRDLALVLGAGASMPYGFPSGYELKRKIVEGLDPAVQTSTTGMRHIVCAAGFTPAQVEAFRSALGNSGKKSVDAFLEHRADFLDVGKVSTAAILLPLERQSALFEGKGPNWYEYFFNKLNARFEDFDKNRVSVLTFNYDRSLEHYLLTALRNSYGKTLEECAEKLKSVPIVHLHGDLGDLPLQATGGVPYGGIELTSSVIRHSASRIQIIHEDVSDKPQFQQAHHLLRRAQMICFVGFGYDATNAQRLSKSERFSNKQILGSAKDITEAEAQIIRSTMAQLGFVGIALERGYSEALMFLRHYCVFD